MRGATIAVGAALVVAAVGYLAFGGKSKDSPITRAAKQRAEGHQAFANGDFNAADSQLEKFISEHQASESPQIQDEVASAGMTLAYSKARQGNYDLARKQFLEVAKGYSGTQGLDPDFGRLDDQAAYQAIVCLQAEGKDREAKAEYEQFIKSRPLSPLVHAAYKRLTKLSPADGELHRRLLQEAITKQEQNAKAELALCGPRVVEELLRCCGKTTAGLEEIKKLCGTTTSGTTLSGMKKGLQELGFNSTGMLLSRDDFENVSTPAIWLMHEHYVLLLAVSKGVATIYDPMTRTERKLPLPKDQEFSATVLTLSNLEKR